MNRAILNTKLMEANENRDTILDLYDEGVLDASHVDRIDYQVESLKNTIIT